MPKRIKKGRGFTERYAFACRYRTPSRERSPRAYLMAIEILEGTLTETQTTEDILSAPFQDVSGAHQGVGTIQDTKIEEVEVGASLAVQCVAVLETMVAARVQYVFLVLKTGGLQ
nr:uncharacterized protein LOC112710113 [Arachis hypogaea]